jgi:hypothetical protein
MARTIGVIQQALIATLVTTAAAAGVVITPTEWSAYDYRQLITYTVAVAQASLEQLWDAFRTGIEALISSAAPLTAPWIRAQMLKFQYSATDPQEIQLNLTTLAPEYPIVNPALQIIKYCSVVKGGLGSVSVKCAAQAGGVPVALDFPQKAAAKAYIEKLVNPGISYPVISLDSDKMKVGATVFYDGLYAAVISSSVQAAIVAYMAGIPFDGQVTLSKLVDAIQGVPGVIDVVLTEVKARQDATPYSGATGLVLDSKEIQRLWKTVAGYIVPETTAGQTLTDTLDFQTPTP